jgi:hypothetical protein
VQSEMSACADRIQGCLVELNDLGVAVRDCGTGLVDFPGRVAGHDVCFAWQLGEDRVEHWRDPHDDSGAWRPISELAVVWSADGDRPD